MGRFGIIPAASVAALFFSFAVARADNPLETRGKIDSVTVYRGEALVTRLVDVPGPAGLKELVVTDLPEQVLPGSIYAESAEGVEVRSVSYRARPVEKDVREAVRKLDDQLLAIQDKLTANQRHSQLLAEQREFLTKVEQFTAPTAIAELSKGVLNAETRDLVEKTEATQGGNRVIQFNYRVALENFSTKPAAIRVLDRLPIARENEIKVTLLQPGKDLSKDPAYERQDKKKGILRWDLDVPAQALAAKAAAFEYQFQLEYDKQLFVTGMPARK